MHQFLLLLLLSIFSHASLPRVTCISMWTLTQWKIHLCTHIQTNTTHMLYICIYSAPANNILSHLFIIQQQRELASEARSNYFYFCFFYCFFFFPSLRQVRVRSVKAPFSSFGSNSLRWLINWACTKTVKENIFAPLTHKNKNRNKYIKKKPQQQWSAVAEASQV